jgi:DHA2 family multidrug resistance protein
MSFGDIFLMLTLLFLAMILGVLMLSKPNAAGGGGGGGH